MVTLPFLFFDRDHSRALQDTFIAIGGSCMGVALLIHFFVVRRLAFAYYESDSDIDLDRLSSMHADQAESAVIESRETRLIQEP